MKTEIVIVGGGPCGLLTALLLGRLGVQTVLLEKHREVLDHPKAMGVMRRTNEIFRQMGLLERVAAGAMKSHPDALSVWFRGSLGAQELGRALMSEDDPALSPCTRFHCPQPHIERVLRDEVARQPSVKCLYETHFESLEQDAQGIRVAFTNHQTGQAQTIEAQYLVAADGDRSAIRDSLSIVRQGPGERGRFLSVYFKADLSARLHGRLGVLCNVVDEDMFEAFVAVNGKDLWLMHHFLDESDQNQTHTAEQMKRVVARASGVLPDAVEILSMNPWVMSPAVAPRWRSGRVFLVGDAAARVSPSGGLGMNNGLQSAHNLAWKLARVVNGAALESLLDSYEQERLPAARFTFENSEGNSNEVFNAVQAAMSGQWDRARDIVQHSRRAASGYGQDFGIVYDSGAITPDGTQAQTPADVVNEYIAQARPGHRAPNFEVQVNGKADSVFSLLDYQYTALLGPKAEFAQYKRLWPWAVQVSDDRDFSADPAWLSLYDISKHGAVLIRPDGYVAAREPCR